MGGQVECYSGSQYAERPVALHWEGQRLEIETIEGEWHSPDGKRFRVRTRGDQVFELLYVGRQDTWQVRALGWQREAPAGIAGGDANGT